MHEPLPDTDLWKEVYSRRPSDLRKLSDLPDWRVAHGEPDIRGWTVFDEDNRRPYGTCDDLLVSTDIALAVFMILYTGEVMGESGVDYGLHAISNDRYIPVPMDRIELDRPDRRVLMLCSFAQLQDAPDFDSASHDYGPYYDYWSSI